MEVIPVRVEKEIAEGDDLAALLLGATRLEDGDVVVVAQKAVSKSEGMSRQLCSVKPSLLAQGIASQYGKDPRLVELILSESERIVRMRAGILIVRTHHGIVCANAGIDESNVPEGYATLLPSDPGRSAAGLRKSLEGKTRGRIAVLVSDTFGRPFRMGQANCAIGVSGMAAMLDYRGTRDTFGRELRTSEIAVSDELCSAAELVMAKSAGCPFALVRGYGFGPEGGGGLLRPPAEDLFA